MMQLATTIPVRNVQALAASAPGELTAEALNQYIRPDMDHDSVLPEDSAEVPVVDLSRLLSNESVKEEASKLKFACEEWGFVQVVNHGVPEDIIVNIKRDIQEFFQLPLDVKNAYAQRPGDLQGYGQAYVVSNHQKLDWADMFAVMTQPPEARDMKYWPTQPGTFRKSIQEYSSEVGKLAHSIVKFIGNTLNIDPGLLTDKYAVQALRINYYPPCNSMAEKVLGFSPHSDASLLTILLQINSVDGLQIRRHGAWIPVKSRADALLVNVGDFLEIMSNGRYKSIEHRVIINPRRERLSVSAFHIPKFDGVVSPIVSTDADEKVLYKTVTVEEYVKHQLSNKLDGKKALDHAKAFQVQGK
ncbi:hypothetical protein QOZ80_5AG0387030 [Eleusine coracana subsp. coracana]|nr:hypothetical protein QOZ80_5AG0387030 [Eleusine coracana subsp. coracana]